MPKNLPKRHRIVHSMGCVVIDIPSSLPKLIGTSKTTFSLNPQHRSCRHRQRCDMLYKCNVTVTLFLLSKVAVSVFLFLHSRPATCPGIDVADHVMMVSDTSTPSHLTKSDHSELDTSVRERGQSFNVRRTKAFASSCPH